MSLGYFSETFFFKKKSYSWVFQLDPGNEWLDSWVKNWIHRATRPTTCQKELTSGTLSIRVKKCLSILKHPWVVLPLLKVVISRAIQSYVDMNDMTVYIWNMAINWTSQGRLGSKIVWHYGSNSLPEYCTIICTYRREKCIIWEWHTRDSGRDKERVTGIAGIQPNKR